MDDGHDPRNSRRNSGGLKCIIKHQADISYLIETGDENHSVPLHGSFNQGAHGEPSDLEEESFIECVSCRGGRFS